MDGPGLERFLRLIMTNQFGWRLGVLELLENANRRDLAWLLQERSDRTTRSLVESLRMVVMICSVAPTSLGTHAVAHSLFPHVRDMRLAISCVQDLRHYPSSVTSLTRLCEESFRRDWYLYSRQTCSCSFMLSSCLAKSSSFGHHAAYTY